YCRHRSFPNFIVNLIGGIVTYCLSTNKPKFYLKIRFNNRLMLS
ncbi:MAG: IS982 family transposase, partial [Paramuribaculum sp.]|nr:IS982 family transposase [Paramuribaculum sp.]